MVLQDTGFDGLVWICDSWSIHVPEPDGQSSVICPWCAHLLSYTDPSGGLLLSICQVEMQDLLCSFGG